MEGILKKRPHFLNYLPYNNGVLRKRLTILIFLSILLVYIFYTVFAVDRFGHLMSVNGSVHGVERYLIHTSTCRIPYDDPLNKDVRKLFSPESYVKCTDKMLLSYIERTEDSAILKINESLLSMYSFYRITCCYSSVTRIARFNQSDDSVRFSACKPFENSVNVTHGVVKVICKNANKKEVYSNVHAVIHPHQISAQKRSKSKSYGVIFIGIDSISKTNLLRMMPKTWQFLESHDFINLKGYTKIGDNTFPNLLAILTGRTWTQVYNYCHPGDRNMDDCDIIWDRFRKMGYITAYAEDESAIGTFHYGRKGFYKLPTDYYFRPYMLAAETLGVRKIYGMTYCTGPETSGERILNVAKDFITELKHYPKFGLFWMNSFSHDNLNSPSMMDLKVADFLNDVYKELHDDIFIFFSDHGFRFGRIRYTHTGWLEERLPFIYVYLPRSFKQHHKAEYDSFLLNSERLTAPYDLYMTLQDILALANQSYNVQPSQGCPKCHSLFRPVNEARTCKDSAIDQHWCLCTGHLHIDTNRFVVRQAAEYVISEINTLIRNYSESEKCAEYSLGKVISAGMSEKYVNEQNQTVHYFLLMIQTKPPAMFEATVEKFFEYSTPAFRLLGDISRTSRYGDNSRCVQDSTLKKYCYCDAVLNFIKSAICSISNCF